MKHLLASTFLLVFVGSICAKTYHVSMAGDDSNTGASPSEALATLQHGVNQIDPGDSIIVHEGTYAGCDLRDLATTETFPIVLIAPQQNVIIDGGGPLRNDGINVEGVDYVEINGFQVIGMINGGNGIRVVLSDHCVVRNCICDQNDERGIFTAFTDDILIENNTCTNSVDEHGIYVSNSSDRAIIRYNTCFGNSNIGIHLNGDLSAGGDGIMSDVEVYGNYVFENNLAAGINMDGCLNPLVYNNVIYNNHFGQGIACFQQDGAIATQGAKIYHNIILVPEDGRWGILLRDGAHLNADIKNNIIINQHSWRGCIASEGTNSLSSDYNILQDKMSNDGDGSSIPLAEWQTTGLDNNSLLMESLEALFTDHEVNDFRPAVSAQSIDAASTDLQSTILEDILGRQRIQGNAPDIGAYEVGHFLIRHQITLTANSIEFVASTPSSALQIMGPANLFSVSILSPNGDLFEDLSGQNEPIQIDLNALPSLDYLLHIKSFTNPALEITDDFH